MIIVNEKHYVEQCLINHKLGDDPFRAINLIARYLYHNRKIRGQALEDYLGRFIKTYSPPCQNRYVEWDTCIRKAAAHAPSHKVHDIHGVWITNSELERIKLLRNKKMERVAFTMLCIAKLNNIKNADNNGWVNCETQEIFKLARVSITVNERFQMLGDLKLLGLLEFPKRNGNLNNRVTFIDDGSKKMLLIRDFRELGYEYLKYSGEKFTRCKNCGILIRGNANNSVKYCRDCAEYKNIMDYSREFICVDCGKLFTSTKDGRPPIRCPECSKNKANKDAANRMNRMRKRQD